MPIYHQVEQRSDALDALRLGIPTASCFHMIITPGGKPSEQLVRYAHHLIAERLIGRHVNTYTSPAMEKGMAFEEEAAFWYEFSTDTETQPIGFVSNDAPNWRGDGSVGSIGCSPDRLIGDDGLLEIKCPEPAAQIGYLIPPPLDVQKSARVRRRGEPLERQIQAKYKPQVQGNLWLSQREWIDCLAFSAEHEHGIPHSIVRVTPEKKYIDLLKRHVTHFAEELDRVEKLIRSVARGVPRAELKGLLGPKQELREMLQRSLEASP